MNKSPILEKYEQLDLMFISQSKYTANGGSPDTTFSLYGHLF